MEGPTKFKFVLPLTDRRERLKFVKNMLDEFAQNRLPA
ncbi:hypothetical protein JCM19233_1112 [Vibrio astriarenae]|nr:hypothetical protein JCM19233_1112 [Vibrio sp. C7]